ncbi:MAG: hypothetical protein Q7R75_01910 [bacterium]|nr:hypothetical protein [bacterium]
MSKILQDIIAKKPTPKINGDFFQKKDKIPKPVELEIAGDELKIDDDYAKVAESGWGSKAKIAFFLFSLVFLAIIASRVVGFFSRAVIQIVPRQETVKTDISLKAGRAIGGNDLLFETMEFRLTKEQTVQASGFKTIEAKASGQIIIYNNFSLSAQTLLQNTRFESPSGKVYRVNKTITVPGMKKQGSDTNPGFIETTVYADKVGGDYNTGLTDFTIPGFKGSPQYSKIYARSKTAIQGGETKQVPSVSDEELKKVTASLESALENELKLKAKSQVPDDFVLYDKAMKIDMSESNYAKENSAGTEQIKLQKTGTLSAFLIPRKELSLILAQKYMGENVKNQARAINLNDLNFALISRDEQNQTMVFRLRGDVKFVWVIDEEQLKQSLIASSNNLENTFKTYSSINKASVIFKPFWWRFFPNKASNIIIEQTI